MDEYTLLGYDTSVCSVLLDHLETYRTLQTSAHTEIASPSRRFCIDWISTSALNQSTPYIIGAFSGVPFSNKSKPGRFTWADSVYNLIDKKKQDALVYNTHISEDMYKKYASLDESLRALIAPPRIGDLFSLWASNVSSSLLSKSLERSVYVFDINRVATHYILSVIDDAHHPVTQLLLDPHVTERVLAVFGNNTHLFYTSYETGKYSKQENVYYMDGYGFAGDHQQFPQDKNILVRELKNGNLCPGTLLVFTIFAFLNEFQCLGSFVQVEYLTRFKHMWQELDMLGVPIEHIPTNTLTTGMFPHAPHIASLDIATDRVSLSNIINPDHTLLDYYLPIWQNGNYYTNKQTS
ncbi:MAG: hypothetical protein LRY46_01370 [Candidatus Pacebacteria bacterium]|nr:hypothetical protein [Candidatus Paceibacterota bacterium]